MDAAGSGGDGSNTHVEHCDDHLVEEGHGASDTTCGMNEKKPDEGNKALNKRSTGNSATEDSTTDQAMEEISKEGTAEGGGEKDNALEESSVHQEGTSLQGGTRQGKWSTPNF